MTRRSRRKIPKLPRQQGNIQMRVLRIRVWKGRVRRRRKGGEIWRKRCRP